MKSKNKSIRSANDGRATIIKILNENLAQLLDLGLQAKQAHWNVRGSNFIELHRFFDKLAAELSACADDVAERVAALGGFARGTIQEVSQSSTLAPYPVKLSVGGDHVLQLHRSLGKILVTVRKGRELADADGDNVTTDILSDVLRVIEKQMWIMDAQVACHFESDLTPTSNQKRGRVSIDRRSF